MSLPTLTQTTDAGVAVATGILMVAPAASVMSVLTELARCQLARSLTARCDLRMIGFCRTS